MERMTCIVKNPSYRVSQGRLRPSFLPLRRLGTLLKFPRLRTKPSQKTFNFLVLSTHSLVLLAIRLVAFLDSNSFFSRLWSLFPPKGSRSKCVESSRAISMSLSLLLRALSAGAPECPPRGMDKLLTAIIAIAMCKSSSLRLCVWPRRESLRDDCQFGECCILKWRA